MNSDLTNVLLLLAAAIVMFAFNRPRIDAVALIMIVALPFTGVLGANEAIAGFSDPSVVLIAALFVLGEGLVRTGVAQRLGDWLVRRAGDNEGRLLVLLMAMVVGLGSFMSSTGVVAIFIPVTLRIARRSGTAPGRLMMPLSFAGLMSGMMTLVATTPNLVINSELVRAGHRGFSFFSITPFGAVIFVLGAGYMLLARRWLKAKSPGEEFSGGRPSLATWVDQYKLAGRERCFRVGAGSPLVGRRLDALDLRGSEGINLLGIERHGRFSRRVLTPEAGTELREGDVLLFDLFDRRDDFAALPGKLLLQELPLTGGYFSEHTQDVGMVEVFVPAESKLVGKTVVEARVRSEYGLTMIGLRRGRTAYDEDRLKVRFQTGDTLLLAGAWKAVRRLQSTGRDLLLLNLPVEFDAVLPATRRAPHALASLAVVVVLMVTGVVANVQAALIGCLLMGVLGCIDFNSAYRSIHWQSLVLIVGMLPFSIALQRTGGIALAADALVAVTGGAGVHAMLAGLFALTAIVGLFISNTATAVLMAPIAIGMAASLQASPYPFAMIVALAASAAFMTPVSSPVNTLVIGPGGYSFGDFVRIGVPFTLIVLVVSVWLVPWLLPLY